jgi:hypothetical protein
MKSSLFLLAGSLIFASAYAGSPAAAPNLHALMKNVVAVQAQVIWDVGNHALDADGNADASKVKAADWTRLLSAGGKVKQVAQTLAQADHVMAAAPGQKVADEGTTPGALGAKEVQNAIDANPKVFRAFAQALAVSMDQIVTAAQAKDAPKLFDVSGRLDQVCEDCHKQFWYPEPKTPR